MLAAEDRDSGVVFPVRVIPRASRDQVAGVENGVLKVRLTAPPVEGAANLALVKYLSKALGVSRGSVKLVSGEKSRNKRLEVLGLTSLELKARLGL